MRKLMAAAAAVVLFQGASAAWADGVSFSINVGGPPIVISQPPDFLYPPELGFGVAVGVPYDMFYLGGVYYINRGGGWYRTSSYGGEWIKVRPRELPPEFRRYKMGRIHQFRDREYRMYARDHDHYRGKYFRPGRDGREERHEMKEERHDEHRDMREQRHDEHGGEIRDEHHEEHHDERR
jgi:hypothetical protein